MGTANTITSWATSVNLGFVYALKDTGDGTPRYKARLVYKNHPFINTSTWDEVFSPVVNKDTIRLFFTIVGRGKMFLKQGDVVTAYLNADMDEPVYIKLPKICGDEEGFVRVLWKALYGHPKAGQLWNNTFVNTMTELGFTQSSQDRCFFIHIGKSIYLVLYVDDVLAACKNKAVLERFWRKLCSTYSCLLYTSDAADE